MQRIKSKLYLLDVQLKYKHEAMDHGGKRETEGLFTEKFQIAAQEILRYLLEEILGISAA